MQRRQQLAVPHRHADLGDGAEGLGGGAKRGPQPVDPTRTRNAEVGTRNTRGEDRVRIPLSYLAEKCLRVRQQVGLVEHVHDPLALLDVDRPVPCSAFRVPRSIQPHLGQRPVDHLDLFLPGALACVDHVQQQIRLARFLQRGAERRDQMMRELADEPDGVGQTKPVVLAYVHFARQRVERGEQAVLDEHVLARERLEQARLAGVGVADQRRARQVAAAVPLVGAVIGHLLEPPLQPADLAADRAAVGLELRLARPPEPDAAADARQVRPHALQARQQILELRQLDLQLRLVTARPRREDVENHFGAVHDPHAQRRLEVLALHR